MLRFTPVAVAASLALLVVACAAESSEPGPEDGVTESSAAALTTTDAVSRADQWASAKLHYCQAANHARDYDSACSTYCNRMANAAWDPYRSDCSGLVSWAWALPAPGRVTTQFAPFQSDITHAIPATQLRAGDAVNNSDHIMLFKQWLIQDKRALFIEEPGCSSAQPYAHETTSDVSISGNTIHVVENGMAFTAIRYGALTTPPPKPAAHPPTGTTGTPDSGQPNAVVPSGAAPSAGGEEPASAGAAAPATASGHIPAASDGCASSPGRVPGSTSWIAVGLAALVALRGRRRGRG
jgi:uncharacterized protein (TIGR03382 family)